LNIGATRPILAQAGRTFRWRWRPVGLASRNFRRIELANQRVLELAQIGTLTGLLKRAVCLEKLKDADERRRQSILKLDLGRLKTATTRQGSLSSSN
jgi:hypothetical protein